MSNITKKLYLDISRNWSFVLRIKTLFYKLFWEWRVKSINNKKSQRFLEIGPGFERIINFETINIVKTKNTDYVGDASRKIDFSDNTFDMIYASHILEHVPWYMISETLKEWFRILKKGGQVEIWVPDGLKIAQAFCDAEYGRNNDYLKDGWFKFNNDKDAGVWFAGRMFSYGDGVGTRGHYNYHLSSFSERYLKKMLEDAGFTDIIRMAIDDCRGYNHGWINMGIKATKE